MFFDLGVHIPIRLRCHCKGSGKSTNNKRASIKLKTSNFYFMGKQITHEIVTLIKYSFVGLIYMRRMSKKL